MRACGGFSVWLATVGLAGGEQLLGRVGAACCPGVGSGKGALWILAKKQQQSNSTAAWIRYISQLMYG